MKNNLSKHLKKAASILLLLALTSVPAFAATVKVTTTEVHFREGAGTNYDPIDNVPKGTRFEVLGSKKDNKGRVWYKAHLVGYDGYLCGAYTKDATARKVKATDGNSYIRSSANKDAKALTVLKKGATATYLEAKKTDSRGVVWYKVEYNGKTGWISSKYTELQK